MFPVVFETNLGGLSVGIPTFTFFIAAAIGLTVLVLVLVDRDVRTKPFAFVVFLGAVFLSSAVFAKVGQIIIEFADPANNGRPWFVILSQAGATVTTGLIGGVLAIFVYARLDPHRIITWKVLDSFAVAFPFGHMAGRVGCHFNGCCYGGLCDVHNPFGITYPENWIARIAEPDLPFGPRYPSPLFEAAGLLLIGLVLLAIFRTTKTRGQIVPLYMMLYAVLRFTVEFSRGDLIRGVFGGLSTGQWFSIVLFVLGAFLLIQYIRAYRSGSAGPPFRTLNGSEPSETDAFVPQRVG